MTNLAELIQQRDAIDAQVQILQAASRAEGIAAVRALMAETGVTLSDLAPPGKQRANGGIAPKYRDGSGNTWSGRGIKPKWLSAAVAAGATVEQFLIAPGA